jgi:hypothetical protein
MTNQNIYIMLYFPLKKTKIHLIILFVLIMFNVSFETNFKKDFNKKEYNPDKYESVRTHGSYVYGSNPIDFLSVNLPEETAILIYLGYFIIVTRIILSAKLIKKESENEEQ